MTHIYFKTPDRVFVDVNSFDTNTVPRIGEEVWLKFQGQYIHFKVEKVSWYPARDPWEGLEAEIELSLCEG